MDEKKLKRICQTLCHDTRGAIGASASLTSLFEREYSSVLDAKGMRWLSLISKECNNAQHKLTGFREYAQLFDCNYQFSTCNLNEVLARCVNEAQTQRTSDSSQSLLFDCDSIPLIHSSPELLSMFFKEVFVNAIEHAQLTEGLDKPTMLKCKVSYRNQGGYHVIICEDNGQAISPDKLTNIQQPFKSSEQSGTSHSGMGFSKLHRISELLEAHMDVSSGESPYTGLRVSLSFRP